MQTWQAVFLGARELSREISAFELETSFTFSGAERQLIEQRRDPLLKLGPSRPMAGAYDSSIRLNWSIRWNKKSRPAVPANSQPDWSTLTRWFWMNWVICRSVRPVGQYCFT